MSDDAKKPKPSGKTAVKLAILAVVLAALGLVVMISVKPSYVQLYSTEDMDLPGITKICINGLTPILPLIFAFVAVAIALFLPNKELAEALNMIIIILIYLTTVMFFIGMSLPLTRLLQLLK